MNDIRERLHNILFESDTRQGKLFSIILECVIVFSVVLVMLASVTAVYDKYQKLIQILEWIITVIFSVEYILRIAIAKRPFRYIFSFYGIVDFFAVIPTYMGLFFVGSHSFVVIRLLRLLRIFRILKLTRYTQAGGIIVRAMWASRQKILVFILFIVIIAVIMGTIVYLVEGEASGFTSIPISVYWAIVTLTTVGYGDISPITPLGRFIASIIMIMGYAIIAVPTGIVTAEMIKATGPKNTHACPQCLFDKHDDDAVFCKRCGVKIN